MAQKPKTQGTQVTAQAIPQPAVQENAHSETQAFMPVLTPGNQAVQTNIKPNYPVWPSSKPGPQKKQPPVGTKSFNALRSEQVTGIIQAQNTHTSAEDVKDDEVLTAQEASRVHKKRIE